MTPDDLPVVIAANHASQYDIFALFAAFPYPIGWLAKDDLFRIPVFGRAMLKMGYVPINRDNPREALASIKAAARHVREGNTIVVFPEGTRSPDGRLKEFKKGVFTLIMRSGRPVVPVAIVGSHRVQPPDSIKVSPGPIEVKIGAPIETEGIKPRERGGLMERVRGEISRMLGEAG